MGKKGSLGGMKSLEQRQREDNDLFQDEGLLEAEIARLRAAGSVKGADSEEKDRAAGRLKMLLFRRSQQRARQMKAKRKQELGQSGPHLHANKRRRKEREGKAKLTNVQGRTVAIGGEGEVPLPPKREETPAPDPPEWPPKPLRSIPSPPPEGDDSQIRHVLPPPR